MTELIPNIKKRYFFKVMRSGIGAVLSAITLPLITRSLGANQYGLFNFIRVFFEKIVQFLDVGTIAFYPKISRRPGDKSIIRFVVYYDLFLFVLSFIALALIFISGTEQKILSTNSIVLASSMLLLVWLILISQKMTSFMDAQGRTVPNEIALLSMRILLTIALVVLFVNDKLNLINFITIQNILFIICLFILTIFAFKFFPKNYNSKSLRQIFIEFKSYSVPLFWASSIGVFASIADRWLLQAFGGSAQQGYYSLGFNLAAICFLLTSSFTPLLQREYAIAFENREMDKLKNLFSKYVPFFYVVSTVIACFLTVHGDLIAPFVGGSDFKQAALPVMLLGLSPIHQTYGQLSGSLMMATDETKKYASIDMFIAIIGLPITYFLLAPVSSFGLGLGALGLAIKLVFIQILAVNIQLWFICKQLGIKIIPLIFHQIVVVLAFLIIGIISKIVSQTLFVNYNFITLVFSGLAYLSLSAIFLFSFPSLISMNRKELIYKIVNIKTFISDG